VSANTLVAKGISDTLIPLATSCQTGLYDGGMEKTCTKCDQSKNISEFPPSANHSLGVRNECRPCTARINREREARKAPKSVRALNYRLKAEGRKHCVYCDTTKLLGQFPGEPGRGVHKGKCLECTADTRMKSNYGITRAQYDDLLAAQGGGCAICGTTSPGGGRGARKFYVDHDHSCCSGRTSCGACVRGLLCNGCNLVLGIVKDDVTHLREAIAYLEAH